MDELDELEAIAARLTEMRDARTRWAATCGKRTGRQSSASMP